MTVIRLVNLLRTHVAPRLAEIGYSHERRSFTKTGEQREVALVEAIEERGVVPTVFTVRCGLALPRNSLQRSGEAPVAPYGSANILWGFDLLPPEPYSDRRYRDTPLQPMWSYDPADENDVATVGSALAETLLIVALPLLNKALEGERRVDELENQGVSTMQWIAPFIPPKSASEGSSPWS